MATSSARGWGSWMSHVTISRPGISPVSATQDASGIVTRAMPRTYRAPLALSRYAWRPPTAPDHAPLAPRRARRRCPGRAGPRGLHVQQRFRVRFRLRRRYRDEWHLGGGVVQRD